MTDWLSIRYRGFWDVPRIFLVRRSGSLYLFDCPFSRDLDDYPDDFTVYLLPEIPDAETPTDWTTLPARALAAVGTVPVSTVRFDPTRRAAIDAGVFDAVRPASPQMSGVAAHTESPTTVP